jgi:hypothetical protein
MAASEDTQPLLKHVLCEFAQELTSLLTDQGKPERVVLAKFNVQSGRRPVR